MIPTSDYPPGQDIQDSSSWSDRSSITRTLFGTQDIPAKAATYTDKESTNPATFDAKSEANPRLKINLMILPTVSPLYLFCFIDRANIGNARLDRFEKDLNMEGYDYNLILSCFFVSCILFEIPANILCKRSDLDGSYPRLRCSSAWRPSVPRIFGAGMMPGIAHYLSRWYRQSELAFRLSTYVAMTPLAGAFGGLLASGILSMNSFISLHRWRMIHGVEVVITTGLGAIAFFTLTYRPDTARWPTPEEKELAFARAKSECLGQAEVLDKQHLTKVLREMLNPVRLIVSFIFHLSFRYVTIQGLSLFLPTIIRTF
ncbi:hypothetical protein PM082_004434 [Marasmius tenuissimus]|nr:hypothetical protein PM082_004434 [Marasmius tenuissimus]